MMVPRAVDASVIFSEIAWMGTPESANAEWIEFYNTSAETIDMSGWKLYESGGSTLVYTFTKQIPGKTYFVLERVTPSAPDPLPDINDEAGSFGGSGLSNSGEHLVLKDVEGTLVAEINFSSGWPAGESEDKKTMQRSNGTWISAAPTPKAPPQTGTIDGSPDTPPSTGGTTAGTTSAPPPPPRSTASYIKIQFPEQVFVGQKSLFSFTPYIGGEESIHGYFYWNMGDGTVYELSKKEKVQHTYLDVGKYSVTVSFGHSPYVEPLLVETILVSVLDPSLALTLEKNGTVLLVSYSGEGVIDVGGWKVTTGEGSYIFPLRSRLLPETALRIKTNAQFPFGSHSVFSLTSSEGLEVATLGNVSVSANVVTRSPVRSLLGTTTVAVSETVNTTAGEDEPLQTNSEEKESKKKPTSFIIFGGLILILIGLFVYLDRKLGGKEEEEE